MKKMKKDYQILEKHEEIGSEEVIVYYNIINKFTSNCKNEANKYFKQFVENYTDKHGSFEGDIYYLVENINTMFIKD